MNERTLDIRRRPSLMEKPTKPKSIGVFGRFKDRMKSILLAGTAAIALSSCTYDMRVRLSQDASVPQDAISDVENKQDAKQQDARQEDARPEDAQQDTGAEDAMQDDASSSDAQEDAQKPWWDTNWQFCRKINLFNSFPSDFSHLARLIDPNFNYSHAKADLTDLRVLEGSCDMPDIATGLLGVYNESVNSPGESLIWFKTKTPNVASVAMYYGNPSASNVFDGNSAFLAFGKNSDFSGFTLVPGTMGGLFVSASGVNFTGYPYRASYQYKDLSELSGDTIIDFTLTYSYSTDCYPYMMVAVTDTLVDKFINAVNGYGYVRQSCGSSPQKSVGLRVRQNNAFVEQMGSSFVPVDNHAYFVRIRRVGTSVNVAFYNLKADRDNNTNSFVSITSTKVPSAAFRYLYMPIGLDAVDGTYWTNGTINDVIVRKAVSPEPVQVMDAEIPY